MRGAREKWDARYRDAAAPGEPSRLLLEFSYLLPPQGRALDLACGLGANALLLAQVGLTTTACDVSTVALTKLEQFARERQLAVHTAYGNLEAEPGLDGLFDVIVVSRYLHRPLLPAIIGALAPSGLLFYQTFVEDKTSSAGPQCADYLLGRNELLHRFAALRVLYYREESTVGDVHRGWRDEAFLIAQAPPVPNR